MRSSKAAFRHILALVNKAIPLGKVVAQDEWQPIVLIAEAISICDVAADLNETALAVSHVLFRLAATDVPRASPEDLRCMEFLIEPWENHFIFNKSFHDLLGSTSRRVDAAPPVGSKILTSVTITI